MILLEHGFVMLKRFFNTNDSAHWIRLLFVLSDLRSDKGQIFFRSADGTDNPKESPTARAAALPAPATGLMIFLTSATISASLACKGVSAGLKRPPCGRSPQSGP